MDASETARPAEPNDAATNAPAVTSREAVSSAPIEVIVPAAALVPTASVPTAEDERQSAHVDMDLGDEDAEGEEDADGEDDAEGKEDAEGEEDAEGNRGTATTIAVPPISAATADSTSELIAMPAATEPSQVEATLSGAALARNSKPKVRFLDDDAEGLPEPVDSQGGKKKTKSKLNDAKRQSTPPLTTPASQSTGEGLQMDVPASFVPLEVLNSVPPSASSNSPNPVVHASTAAPAAKPMTPAERLAHLKTRVETEKRDGEAWLALVEATQNQEDLEEAKNVYEELLSFFPYAAKQWIAYIDLLLAQSDFKGAEAVFARCLRSTASVELWRSYLSYTRRINPLPAAPPEEHERVRKIIEGAYEFALGFVGGDRDAGGIWQEYLAFLKERKSGSTWEEGQKMDAIRKAYQRAITQPTNDIEKLWREYDQYENSVNRATAKKFLAERSAAYMTARGAQREMASLLDSVPMPLLPRVPSWLSTTTSSSSGRWRPRSAEALAQRERVMVEAWKKYLKWEEGNPLMLEDSRALQTRISFAFKKAASALQFFPELWYNAYLYFTSVDNTTEAVEWLEKGLKLCPGSFLLSFARIEHAEKIKQTEPCAAIFEKLLESIHARIDARRADGDAQIAAIEAEIASSEAALQEKKAAEGADEAMEGDEREHLRRQNEGRQQRKNAIEEEAKASMEEMREEASLVWIKQMQFLRRTEGIRPTRICFGKARKSPHCTWHVYEASALMEYHCSKETRVAINVFELGIKTFGTDEALIVRYLDFLLNINDENNARALFERVIPTLPSERARPVWDRWAEYEYNYGDYAAITKLTARITEAYPEEPPILRFAERSSYGDIDAISTRDLGHVSQSSSAADRMVATANESMHAAIAHFGGADDEAAHTAGPTANGENATGSTMAQKKRRGIAGNDSTDARVRDSASPGPTLAANKRAKLDQNSNGSAATGVPLSVADIPPGVRFFMSVLPMKGAFDGPVMRAEDIMAAIASASLPIIPPMGVTMPGMAMTSGGGGGGGAGSNKKRKGWTGGKRR